jgi:hypothetical protein
LRRRTRLTRRQPDDSPLLFLQSSFETPQLLVRLRAPRIRIDGAGLLLQRTVWHHDQRTLRRLASRVR